MSSRSKFLYSLKRGHFYEKKSLNYLDYDKYEIMAGYHKEYDIKIIKDDITTTYEIKSDRQASVTNNLAIEYEYRGNDSGLYASTADYWIYFIVHKNYEEVYKIPYTKLKCIAEKCRRVTGGDGKLSKMFIIPKYMVQDYMLKSI